MIATIIRLEQFNVGCRHHANGIRFPHVFRVMGFEFDLMDGKFVPGTAPVETFYTLSAEGEFGVANPEIVPIKVLSPQSDKGWIIVRHHATEAAAHAYIDCVGDCRPIPYDYSGPMVWQTEEGIFTLMHRPALPGRPDHLIAYVTERAARTPVCWQARARRCLCRRHEILKQSRIFRLAPSSRISFAGFAYFFP